MEIGLLVLVAVAIPVCAIAGFFMALGLQRRAHALERRLAVIEAQLGLAGPTPSAVPSPLPAAPPPAIEPAASASPENPAGAESAPPTAEPPQPPRPAAKPGFEETLGTRWTVWVGGVALALGGVFLVRYSIEQGLLGPGARVAAGALFALMLIGAGEWLRRRETAPALPGLSSAHVPGVLTAAGTSTAFATAFAAYALYGLIGPGVAFVLLGVIAVLTMIAAALHGPALAALGLVAALGSPLLVQSQQPQPWAVVVYLAFVALAAYGVARLRLWKWLALAAAVGAMIWTVLLVLGAGPDVLPTMAHVAIQIALAGAFLIADPYRGVPDDAARPDRFVGGVFFAFALLVIFVTASAHVGAGRPVFAAVCALMMLGLALRFAPAAPGAAWAALTAVGTLALWPVAREAAQEPWTVVPDLITAPRPKAVETFLTFASALPLTVAAASLWRVARGRTLPLPTAAWFAGAATLGPLAALVVAYWRVAALDRSLSFALVAGGLALAFVAVTAWLRRQDDESSGAVRLAVGATASAAVAALALGLTFALDQGMLTVAFALAALGTAWVSDRLQIPALRRVVAALGVVVLGRLAWDPMIAGGDPGGTLIVNWLLWGYGVPAAAFYLSARILERSGRDRVVRFVESLAIVFAALLVFFEIRHALHGGDPLAEASGHLDMGLIGTASLLFSLLMVRAEARRPDIVYQVASLAFGAVSLLAAGLGLGVVENPLLTGEAILGGALFNSLLLAYLMPAVVAAALAWLARRTRPAWYVRSAAGLALALLLLYAMLAIRRVFQGPSIAFWQATGQGELWTYSVALLVIGTALLAVGVVWNLRLARLVSAGCLVVAVLKVFIVDLAHLEGVMRALSFIGLGLALVGIGFAYQKLLAGRAPSAAPDPA